MKESVAIIGGGVAGLTAAYLLHETCDITLYEKDSRLGGNAYTYRPDGDDVDISVFAFSRYSYTNFFKLLDELGVETRRFGLRGLRSTSYNLDTRDGYSFAPFQLRGFLPSNLREAKSMAVSLARGVQLLDEGRLDGLSMKEAFGLIPELTGHAYLHFAFMLCLTSSMSCDQFMKAPATLFFGKVKRHFMRGPGVWRLVKRRTRTYVEAMADHFRDRIVLNAEIRGVTRGDDGVRLRTDAGDQVRFSKVIFACPADQALRMLDEPTADERRLLGAWKYNDGLVVVHRDDTHFPPDSMRSLYCYLYTDRDGRLETSINACYGRQKGVSRASKLLGTQHPNFPIREELTAFQKVFRTPIFDPGSVAIIAELPTLNGQRHTYYCGSHFGVGLHEDAVSSAVNVAKSFGVDWGSRLPL
ncbi:MAG: FAD-dependent oxidoreductase [Planctomycetota bacterium]